MRSHRWSGSLTVVSAVVVVAALSLLTVTVMSNLGGDDETATVDTDQSTTTVADPTTTTRPRTTTTGSPTTTEAPEVLGDVVLREPGSTTTTVPAPAVPPTTVPATSTTTAPTTTTTICRSSTDPACGPLVWDPQPGPYEVEVYGLELPTTATVGTPVRFAVYYIEPSGPDAHDTCASWETTDPENPQIAGCSAYIDATCPRHGPHPPPTPSRAGREVANELTFGTPGEHVVTLTITTAGQLADGCESPYRQTWSGDFRIVVEEAPPG